MLAVQIATAADDGVEVKWAATSATQTTMTPVTPPKPEAAAKLAGGTWLSGNYANKTGIFAEYAVKVPKTARYQLFARKYWQHGPFRWHFDEGPWCQLIETKLLDSVEMQPGVPVNWVKLGDLNLNAGDHTFRAELIKDREYAWCTVYGLDAFLLTTKSFLGCTVTAAEPPAYVAERQLKTGGNLDENGIPIEPDLQTFGRHLPRTMSLLAGSSPTNHNAVRILFYGQSIVASMNVQAPIVDFLRKQYPNAILICENRAIGGWTAPRLCRTSWQDLYPFYADLVVFHVYEGEDDGTLEDMFCNIRRFTTSEVITWTDHVDALHSLDANREKAAAYRRKLCEQYGFELADVRPLWQEYLKVQQMSEKSLLLDKMIHVSTSGGQLLANMVVRHFRTYSAASDGWRNRVRTIPLATLQKGLSYDAGSWTPHDGGLLGKGAKALRLEFVGNRVDVLPLAVGTGAGMATILLDGKAPSAFGDTYAASRSSLAPGAWWPVVSRLELGAQPVAESWTLAFHGVSPDGKQYAFDLRGAVTGADGSGEAGSDFVSKSGAISVKDRDFGIKTVHDALHKDLPASFEATWRVYGMSRDTWKAKVAVEAGRVAPETLVQFWNTGPHVIEIIPDGNGPVGVQALVVHNPQAL